jgi:PHS family inorganic phosphate transporter-like MFS transporter
LAAAALVAFIITAAYKSALLKETDVTHLHSVDFMWRLLIGLGCVPGTVALYFRLTIPETPRFTMDIERNIDQATHDIKNTLTDNRTNVDPDLLVQRIETPKASWADFRAHFGQLKNFKILFGTAYSWFALDVRLSRSSLPSTCPPNTVHRLPSMGLVLTLESFSKQLVSELLPQRALSESTKT